MPKRLGRGVWIVGVFGLATALVAGLSWRAHHARRSRPHGDAARSALAPVAELARGLRRGDVSALAALGTKLNAAGPKEPVTDDAAVDWLELTTALRSGFGHATPAGKRAAADSAVRIMRMLAVEPAPAGWSKFLTPVHEILASAMSDADESVRAAAIKDVAGLWSWTPGTGMVQAEEVSVIQWKEAMHAWVVRALADAEPKVRCAAVASLGALPIDNPAAPALAYLNDKDWTVRFETLKAFAGRPSLLTEDLILPLLHDPIKELASLAEHLLRGRGLTQEQIGLGRLITHPKPDLRASAIPLLLGRTDIDPIVWLIHLTDDKDANVRLQAVEAFTGRITPEARQRLEELAATDDSDAVRAAAAKLVPAETTAALPPLPGSPSLNPKAN